MKVPGLSVIYQPDGKTPEYAELGLNPYAGCSHNCSYCYNKRADRSQGRYDEPAKGASLKDIEHDLRILQGAGDRRPVHISFVGDPYDTGRIEIDKQVGLSAYLGDHSDDRYIRHVLKAFRKWEHPFQILTKGGMLASKDFDCTVLMINSG